MRLDGKLFPLDKKMADFTAEWLNFGRMNAWIPRK